MADIKEVIDLLKKSLALTLTDTNSYGHVSDGSAILTTADFGHNAIAIQGGKEGCIFENLGTDTVLGMQGDNITGLAAGQVVFCNPKSIKIGNGEEIIIYRKEKV